MADRPFEAFPLDVGLRTEGGDAVESVRTDDLLVFAGIEPIRIPTVSLERQVAEKLHAYTRAYEGGRSSTRVKDLVDLVLIAELSDVDAETLRREISSTFDRRATHLPPTFLPSPPSAWSRPFGRLAEEVGISVEPTDGHRTAASMLDPILANEVENGLWSSADGSWSEHSDSISSEGDG